MRRVRSFGLFAVAVAAAATATGCGSSRQSVATTTVLESHAAATGASVPSSALGLQQAFEEIVRRVSSQIVQIETPEGLGSGVVFDTKGDVVTNAHVVGRTRKVTVTVASGRRYPARVLAAFYQDDLALVRVEGGGATLPAARFADSSKLEVGQIVLAIGNPLGLRSSVTEGIISALGRTQTEETGAILPNVIQTSAPINPGNSGGALVDLQGRVIGIPTLAAGSPLGGAAPGIGFAIASDTVTDIAGQIATHGKVTRSRRAFIGVVAAPTDSGRGVLVAKVLPDSGAAKAGLEPGDVIASVNGRPTPTLQDLALALANLKPGQKAKITVVGKRRKSLQVKLGEMPAR
jgi:S1-C subfamily serine protease